MKPILFEWQGLSIHALPFFMGLALGLACLLSRQSLIKHNIPLKGFNVFYIQGLFFAWMGAKIFFLLHSTLPNAWSYASRLSFWMGGGLVFHGGCLFVLIFVFFYCHLFKRFPADSLRFFIPPVCFAQAIGRMGCLLSGCCYGIKGQIPWKVFVNDAYRHPVQLYESGGVVVLGVITGKLVKRGASTLTVAMSYLGGYAAFRFILEFFRGDAIRGVYSGFSAAQWFSLLLTGVIIVSMSRYAKVSS